MTWFRAKLVVVRLATIKGLKKRGLRIGSVNVSVYKK
jgi:hypothetical protein